MNKIDYIVSTENGDILMVYATGAYNYSMASNYNRLPKPAVVMVKDGKAREILPTIYTRFTFDYIYVPERNAEYGCWYLGFLMNRYHGDMRCSSAAYHSGQGTVDKWLVEHSELASALN